MQQHIKRIVVLAVGWTLVAFGVVGLFLPILQGVLFILLGLLVLSRESETAHRWLEQGRKRHPHLDERLKRWGTWWRKRLGIEEPGPTPDDE